MAYSIEELKNVVGSGGGVASGNLFRVILPAQEQSKNIDLLCRSTNMPGRQILTNERLIGISKQTVAYGYEKPNVTMTFLVLNDPYVRYFFEEWMNLIVNNTTYQIGYFNDYTRNINIQQLKPTTTIDKLQANITSPTDPTSTSSGSTRDFDIPYDVVYACLLEDAYPVTMTGPQYNDAPDQLVEISVDFVYKNWKSNRESSFLERNHQKVLLQNSKPPQIPGGA